VALKGWQYFPIKPHKSIFRLFLSSSSPKINLNSVPCKRAREWIWKLELRREYRARPALQCSGFLATSACCLCNEDVRSGGAGCISDGRFVASGDRARKCVVSLFRPLMTKANDHFPRIFINKCTCVRYQKKKTIFRIIDNFFNIGNWQ